MHCFIYPTADEHGAAQLLCNGCFLSGGGFYCIDKSHWLAHHSHKDGDGAVVFIGVIDEGPDLHMLLMDQPVGARMATWLES